MSEDERDEHVAGFHNPKIASSTSTVTSSDGQLTVKNVRRTVRKPGQRRRSKAEQSTPACRSRGALDFTLFQTVCEPVHVM